MPDIADDEQSAQIHEGHPWLHTMGGKFIDLINPTANQIDFRRLSIVLARVPRFGAHTEGNAAEIYSVAQHCREGAYALLRETRSRRKAAAFLLHDLHEAIMGDIATPIADALAAHAELTSGNPDDGAAVRRGIRSLKCVLDAAIHAAAGMSWPLDPETREAVERMDIRMCRTERDARMAVSPMAWDAAFEDAEPVEGVMLAYMPAGVAAAAYLTACVHLLPEPVADIC